LLGPKGIKRTETVPTLPLERCLAKSRRLADGSVVSGRGIVDHSLIVGEVARELIRRMPPWLRSELFPEGSELIAASHDIGKVSPTFQKKIYSAITAQDENVVGQLKGVDSEIESQWGGHAGVSQATERALEIGRRIPEIVGQHHGFIPNLSFYNANSEVFGGDPWLERRVQLLERIKETLGVDFPDVRTSLQARILAGLTTVSDWIGSGSLFEDPSDDDWKEKIGKALDRAGFVPPDYRKGLSFCDVFGFEPKDSQVCLYEAASQPGVYILEAPMGSGKTEAALYAAYRIMESGKATGFYFALPTQLTSDRIHDRVNLFLKTILDDRSPHKKALLLHGNAWLRETEMGEEGNPGGSWFFQGKRGILAPFAVGTIDQALMAVMNVKHGFVRTFGLTGKVVILDEVHSYDSYTGTILDALVSALRQIHCTVIILSATLTKKRRVELLGIEPQSDAYPLITAAHSIGTGIEISVKPLTDVPVDVFHRSESDSIQEALERAEKGQQVLWIENTIQEAQGIYRKIAARSSELGIECGLLHSRFTKSDRASNEKKWVSYFGKNNAGDRLRHGRILVGTQVLEQSLDIDADFLVTRIAPTDMLLQRIGRLWRHERTVRPLSARREAWILAPPLESVLDAPDGFGGTGKVYAPYILCRTLTVWKDLSGISLPSQIRELVEATYEAREETGQMQHFLYQVGKRTESLGRLALLGLAEGGMTYPEEKAETRYSTREEVEVLLIRSFRHEPEQKRTSVELLDNTRLVVPISGRSLDRESWRSLSLGLKENTIKVPIHMAPKVVGRKEVQWLGDYFFLGNSEESQLRIGLVEGDGRVRSMSRGEVSERYAISYSAHIGYQAKRKEG